MNKTLRALKTIDLPPVVLDPPLTQAEIHQFGQDVQSAVVLIERLRRDVARQRTVLTSLEEEIAVVDAKMRALLYDLMQRRAKV